MVLVVEEQRWKGEGNNEKDSERTEADLFYITIGILIHKDLGIFFENNYKVSEGSQHVEMTHA